MPVLRAQRQKRPVEAGLGIALLSESNPAEELQQKPNEVDEPELRAAVGKYWEIDEIRPAFIYANMPPGPDVPFQLPPHDKDDKGRTKMPAFLLTAHKAG